MTYHYSSKSSGCVPAIGLLIFFVAFFAAWVTHVVVCIKTAAWGFLVAGALFFPIGIVHGVGVWFGAFGG